MPRKTVWEPASSDELKRFDGLLDTIIQMSTTYKDSLHTALTAKSNLDVDDVVKYTTSMRSAITEIESLVRD
jgi:hypothetical protein